MSHHHRKQFEEKDIIQTEQIDNPVFSLLEKNDIALLSMLKPMFSLNGQKTIDFLITTVGGESKNSIPDLSGILNQLMPNEENNKIKDLLPFLPNLLSNPEIKNIITPTLLTTFMSMLANKKEPAANERETIP